MHLVRFVSARGHGTSTSPVDMLQVLEVATFTGAASGRESIK